MQLPDRELKKGSAELLILSLLEDRPRHGYEIGQLIRLRSRGALRFNVGLPLSAPLPIGKAWLGSRALDRKVGATPSPLLSADARR